MKDASARALVGDERTVVRTRQVDDAQAQLTLVVVHLGGHLAHVRAVLNGVGDRVAIDMEDEAGVELEDGKGHRREGHWGHAALMRGAQQLLEVHGLHLWPVDAVHHLARHGFSEHRVECAVQGRVEVADGALQLTAVVVRQVACIGEVLRPLAKVVHAAERGENAILHLVAHKAARLFVLLARELCEGALSLELLLHERRLHLLAPNPVRHIAQHEEDSLVRVVGDGVHLDASLHVHLATLRL
mmetsp:Transcript_14763/g.45078  ORF Transcript_14763/g.45078 Transcript_14763/m.45078 type:complete len:244 (+) Transcript_14763:552-1283(+)